MLKKLICGNCIFLNKRVRQGTKISCYKQGKNKGHPACKYWELDGDSLSKELWQLISQIGSCKDKDVPILRWVLDQQQILIERNLPYRFGDIVYFEVKDIIHKITINSVTSKTISGRSSEGISFTLSQNTNKIFKDKNQLKAYIQEKKAIEKQKEALEDKSTTSPKVGFNPKQRLTIQESKERENQKRQNFYLKKFKPGSFVTNINSSTRWKVKQIKLDTEQAILKAEGYEDIIANLEDLKTVPSKKEKESPKMHLVEIGDSLVSFARKNAEKELQEQMKKRS